MNFRALGTIVLAAALVLLGILWIQQKRVASDLAAQMAMHQAEVQRAHVLEEELKRTKLQLSALESKSQGELKELTRLRALVRSLEETERANSRLKAQRDHLEREIQANRRTPDDETPEWKPAQARTRFAKVIGLALRQFSSRNEGEMPQDIDAAVNALEEGRWDEWVIEHVSANAAALNISEDQYELTFRGRLDSIPAKDAGMIIIAREKNPVKLSNGRWARACVFDDAHGELLIADSLEELQEKESQFLLPNKP